MADSTETKLTTDPTKAELKEGETKPATDPVGSGADAESKEITATAEKSSITGIASNVASNVASNASAAATGVKDSVFSMFGGGAKKERKVEEDDDESKNEPSGSSKAQKKGGDDEEV